LKNVLSQCLRAAEIPIPELGHIHAHGLSTVAGDAEEAQAIAEVLQGAEVPVAAAKSYFGNFGAGSGAVELLTSVLAMHHQQLFPVLNFETPDPDCPVRVARLGDSPGDSFINLSVTPQGQASAVAVRRFVP
jgi:3-oxoacyl-[acyl-carrier-protein] synthase II